VIKIELKNEYFIAKINKNDWKQDSIKFELDCSSIVFGTA
jgi:hypothetical protein